MFRYLLFWLSIMGFSLTVVSSAYGDSPSILTIVLQGGDLQGNFLRILEILNERKLLPMETTEARASETVTSIYRHQLGWSEFLWSTKLQNIIQQISREKNLEKPLELGQIVYYPNIKVDRYIIKKTFDIYQKGSNSEFGRVKQQWGDRARSISAGEDRYFNVELENLRVEIMINVPDTLREAIEALQPLSSPEFVILTSKPESVSAPPQLQCSVGFEGGDLAKDITQALDVLINLNLVKITETRFERGATQGKIYQDQLGIPVALLPLASKINGKDYSKGYNQVGEVIKYPEVRFHRYEWEWRLDTRDPEQFKRQQQILQHWNANSKVSTLPIYKEQREIGNGIVDMVLYGYKLTVQAPDSKTLAAAYKALAEISSQNMVLDCSSDPSTRVKVHSTGNWVSPEKFFNNDISTEDSRGIKAEIGVEASISCYIKRCKPWQTLMINRPFPESTRVIVLDYKVDRSHPELSSAVVEDEHSRPDLPVPHPNGREDKQLVALRGFQPEDHGTHMAGIVAARANGYGVLGVNPAVLIDSEVWPSYDSKHLMLVEKLRSLGRNAFRNLPIILFASEWDLQLKPPKTKVNSQEDLLDDPLARYIIYTRPLIVAAAGQYKGTETPGDDPNGTDLDTQTRRAPMYIGRQPNVIVVTACEECYDHNTRLMQGANYSVHRVHLAAPGMPIFSTLEGGRFGKAGGTSQAAALVAGVASAMVSAYDYYTHAWYVKRRLQVTSYPIPGASIATGAVDFRTALLHPKKHWRIKESQQAEGEEAPYTEFTPKAWCSKSLELNIAGQEDSRSTEGIRRLQRVRQDGDDWIAYHAAPRSWDQIQNHNPGQAELENMYKVERFGPGKLVGDPCLMLKDGSTLKVADSQDIIFADNESLKRVECTCIPRLGASR